MTVLALVLVASGAIGYALRPGTDAPPAVLNSAIQIYVDGATKVSVDETLYRSDARTAVLELDVFGSLGNARRASWWLSTERAGSQPYSCPDPYNYVGQAHPNPFVIRNGGLTLGGAPITDTALADFTGRPVTQAAANTFEVRGVSPGQASPQALRPIAKVTLCWTSAPPLAFDGEYVSATLPAVRVNSSGTAQPHFDVTRNLYFVDPLRQDSPLTAQYSLQAGALPTTTDPFGWHWAADGGEAIQLTGISLPGSQHEAYLGFISGALLGIAGNALVSLVQAATEPMRRSGGRRGSGTARTRTARLRVGSDGRTGSCKRRRPAAGRWWSAGAAALVVALAVGFASTHRATPSAPHPNGRVVGPSSDVRIVDDCYDPGQTQPTTIQLTCGDGSAVLNDLKWVEWAESRATGNGVLNQVVCDPSCVDGHDTDHNVRVVLSEPVRAANGINYFTKVVVDGGLATPEIFQDCWAEPPAPYIPKCTHID